MAPRPLLPLLALAVLLLAPAAAAQLPDLPLPGGGPGSVDTVLTMELQDPGGPLVPERPYSLTLVLHYRYGPGGVVTEDSCATVSVPEPPPWATVTITPERVCFPINPTFAVSGTNVDNTTIVEVNATAGAPALEPFNLTVVAEAGQNGVLEAARGEVSRVVMPAFVGRLEVTAPEAQVLAGGQPVLVPIRVANLGNGPIEVSFRNVSAPQGMRVVLPERFVLPTPGEARDVFVTITAPWTSSVRGDVSVGGVSAHPSRPDMVGDEPRVRFEVQGRAAVPDAGASLLVLAMAGAAVLLTRRP